MTVHVAVLAQLLMLFIFMKNTEGKKKIMHNTLENALDISLLLVNIDADYHIRVFHQ